MTRGPRCPLLTPYSIKRPLKWTPNKSYYSSFNTTVQCWRLMFVRLNTRFNAMSLGFIWTKRFDNFGLTWKWLATQLYSELITSWISRTRYLTSLNRDTYQNIIMKDTLFVKLLNRTPWSCNRSNCNFNLIKLGSTDWSALACQSVWSVTKPCQFDPYNKGKIQICTEFFQMWEFQWFFWKFNKISMNFNE